MIDVLNPPLEIELGYVGENDFRPIQFDVSAWLQEYPQGIVSIVFSRPDGLLSVVENCTESPAEWKPSDADLSLLGSGYVEVRIISGDVLGKSSKIRTRTVSSLGSSGNPPDPPAPDWTVEVAQNASDASRSAASAASSAEAASASALSASGSAASASGSATTATTKASESSESAAAALQSEENASTSATAAESAQTAAETARTGAQTAETNACTYSTSAGYSATEAAGSATDAQSAQSAADSARDAAETAKTVAETAKDAASSSKTAAATSESNAASSASAAATSADNASASATAANTSASNASSSASAAASSATAASTSASAADAAKTDAESYASAAATSEANAASSAQAAANSAASLVVVDDLTTGGTSNALSAEQGRVLSASISELSADVDLNVTNLVTNGDFSNGTTWWTLDNLTASISDAKARLTLTSASVPRLSPAQMSLTSGHKHYFGFHVQKISGTSNRLAITSSAGAFANLYFYLLDTNVKRISSVITSASSTSGYVRMFYAYANASIGDVFDFWSPIVIDLTAAFGSGNEPTADEMDAMLAFYPNSWFDGTVNLASNPKMLPYLLNATRNRPIMATGTYAARPTSIVFPTLYLSTDKAAGDADRLTLNVGGTTWLQI